MRAACALCSIAVALALLPAVARADDALARARREKAALQYARAAELLQQALEQGDSGPERLAEIYRLAGEVSAGLGDADAATRQFERLLAIEPDASLPPGTSPKITGPFERARASIDARGGGLRVHHERGASSLVLVVDADPFEMVAGARARYRGTGGREVRVEAPGRGRIAVVLPQSEALGVVLAAVDAHGNELARVGSWEQPVAWRPAAADSPQQGGGHPVWPYVYGASAASLAVGIYFGLEARDAQDELDRLNADSDAHEGSEAIEIEDRGRRDAWIANAGFAVAGVSAAIATWLLVRDLRAEDRRGVSVAPAVSGDGGGVVLSIPF